MAPQIGPVYPDFLPHPHRDNHRPPGDAEGVFVSAALLLTALRSPAGCAARRPSCAPRLLENRLCDQVPPGMYTVRVWHELLGSIDRPVTVEAGKTATVDFALPMVAPVPPAQAP